MRLSIKQVTSDLVGINQLINTKSRWLLTQNRKINLFFVLFKDFSSYYTITFYLQSDVNCNTVSNKQGSEHPFVSGLSDLSRLIQMKNQRVCGQMGIEMDVSRLLYLPGDHTQGSKMSCQPFLFFFYVHLAISSVSCLWSPVLFHLSRCTPPIYF